MRTLLLFALALPTATTALAAENIDQLNLLSQAQFRDLAGDLGATLSYKAVVPIETLGITGFDVGLEATATKIEHRAAWDQASSGTAPSTIYVPKVHLHKGLPLGFDIGAFYAIAPSTNIDVWGAEVRYALVRGGIGTPAIGLRATYSRLSGVEQLDFTTQGMELGISKGFAFITPYAGFGRVSVEAAPAGMAVGVLQPEKFSDSKTYVGASFNFFGNLALEADKTGDLTSYSVKLGFRF